VRVVGSGFMPNDLWEEFDDVTKELSDEVDMGLMIRSFFFIGGS
jgi:hypothetical protein